MTKKLTNFLAAVFAFGAMVAASPGYAQDADSALVAEFGAVYQNYLAKFSEARHQEALVEIEHAIGLGTELFGPASQEVAILQYNHGVSLNNLLEYERALEVLTPTLAAYERLHGAEDPELVSVLIALTEATAGTHSLRRARKHFKRALRISKQSFGEDSADYGQLLTTIGDIVFNFTRSVEAQGYFERGLEVTRGALGDQHPITGVAAFQLGRYELATRRHNRARQNFELALRTFAEPERPSNKMELSTHAFLVATYEGMKQSDKATEHCLAIGRMQPTRNAQAAGALFQTAIEYPPGSLKRKEGGYVEVEFTIDEQGFVRDAELIQSEGSDMFGVSTMDAIEKWRFAPFFKDGEPVATRVLQKVDFFFKGSIAAMAIEYDNPRSD